MFRSIILISISTILFAKLVSSQCCNCTHSFTPLKTSFTQCEPIQFEIEGTTCNADSYLDSAKYYISNDTFHSCAFITDGFLTALNDFIDTVTYPNIPVGNYVYMHISKYWGTPRDTIYGNLTIVNDPNYFAEPFVATDTTVCLEDTLILDALNPEKDFTWSSGDSSQTIQVNSSGVYWVTISDTNCSFTDSINIIDDCDTIPPDPDPDPDTIITVLPYLPNAFTPLSGIGNNTLKVIPDSLDYSLAIYDRKGKLVYQSGGSKKSWDGTYQGKRLPVGTYIYKMSYNENGNVKTQTGSVLLLD